MEAFLPQFHLIVQRSFEITNYGKGFLDAVSKPNAASRFQSLKLSKSNFFFPNLLLHYFYFALRL